MFPCLFFCFCFLYQPLPPLFIFICICSYSVCVCVSVCDVCRCQLWLTSFFHVCLFVYLLTCLLFLSLFPFFPCFLLLQSQSFPSVRNFSPSGFYFPLLWLCFFFNTFAS